MDRDTIAFMRDIADGMRKVMYKVKHDYTMINPNVNLRHPSFLLVERVINEITYVINSKCDEAERDIHD